MNWLLLKKKYLTNNCTIYNATKWLLIRGSTIDTNVVSAKLIVCILLF